MIVFSSVFKNRACVGDRGKTRKENIPKQIVKSPSRIKIHRQPRLLPTPSICTMPKARRPEKAPPREAVEKKREILHRIEYATCGRIIEIYLQCISCRG